MDYKYIEQLLERYWECQTTLEEEAILRAFFAQADIPARLLPYRDLFATEVEMAQEHLSEEFDLRITKLIEENTLNEVQERTHIVRLTPYQRMRPLWRAAAVVAIVLTIGMAAQQGFEGNEGSDSTYTPQLANGSSESDTLQLFTDMPEARQQTEATLATTLSDTLKTINP